MDAQADTARAAYYVIPENTFSDGADAEAVIASALAAHGAVRIPRLAEPVRLARPIALQSGMALSVHPETVMRMKPGCGGCMVRNAHLLDGCVGPMTGPRDSDILVEGGVWEDALRDGAPDDDDPTLRRFLAGRLLVGVIFFAGADRVTVRGATIRRCEEYGVLLAGCNDFTVRDIAFEDQKKDGLHVNGPSERGVVEHIHGQCGDDILALNAWDWETSAVSFGPIRDIAARDVRCAGGEIRLLPGRKTYPDGEQVACPIERCSFSDIEGVYTFKLYQQPNCHNATRAVPDRSDIPGQIADVRFERVRLDGVVESGFGEVRPQGLFEVGADCRNLAICDVTLGFSSAVYASRGEALVSVGPKSSTWKQGFEDPAKWAELFEPDLVCTAENVSFSHIRFADGPCEDEALLIKARRLTVNEDYPRTTPRGGTGYGVIRGVSII